MAKILLVEDEPLVSQTLSSAMKSKGHIVVTAMNGHEGLAQFAGDVFDLVITDIIMPDMEGIGMMLEMRRKQPNIKIVAISGGGRTGTCEFLKMAQELGAMAIMAKPIPLASFLTTVSECLRK